MLTPTILLIPGSFALPEYYTEVFDAVRAKGYHIQGLHLPSVGLKTGYGREGSAPTMYDDAAFIAKEAENLINEGKDVILIGHSYGGVPVTQSTKGLGVKERQSQGRSRGIVNIAYMTCLVPAIGLSAADMLADVPQEHRTPFEIDVCLSFPFHVLRRFHSFSANHYVLMSKAGKWLDAPQKPSCNWCDHYAGSSCRR